MQTQPVGVLEFEPGGTVIALITVVLLPAASAYSQGVEVRRRLCHPSHISLICLTLTLAHVQTPTLFLIFDHCRALYSTTAVSNRLESSDSILNNFE